MPLKPEGTAFRMTVWKMLMSIPYGETTTYGELARRLNETAGMKTCARAVGNAVGHNPISIIIPCHRVVGADGGLTGYAGGLDVKRKLLKLEQERIY
ncbi:MAG: MGMT family protein [Victivallales bacterium]|nr:MGMT family protein [Victivallales bacterium]